uniref:KilA-N domain-containing protein n=1 Tax=Azospirillum argentinense TaxID=2970906 RepID=UPI0015862606|nr:KilA-N domain-containing protein [Azospirillum argentinense]
MQYHLPFIQRTYAGSVIEQRAKDGFINATAMCKVAGRDWYGYARNQNNKDFLDALERSPQIRGNPVVVSVTTGPNDGRGTWVHPQVAIHLAQWLSPDFAVQVSQWVFEWMSGAATNSSPAATKKVTYVFARRFHLNSGRVDQGYFSIIGELFIRFYAKLEHASYVLPDKGAKGKELRPDVSVGKLFPAWLADNYPEHVRRRKPYPHLFPNGLIFDAWQYENVVLPAFIEYVESVWIPHHAEEYLRKRDPDALQFLPKLLPTKPANMQLPKRKKGAA